MTDAGLGYAWVEFGRRTASGEAQFLVCGMGASARRGTGSSAVTTWHFVTGQRPGKEVDLVAGGSTLSRKELIALEGVEVLPSAAAYRARLAHDLFELPPESYDNLTELLKQLRKPKLGERLNPASLAETLRDALPPLAAQEVTQLAEGWDRLERLRRAVEQTEEAAGAVARFVSRGWRPWVRQVLRRRADGSASATTTLDNTTRARSAAEAELAVAREAVDAAQGELAQARVRERDSGTELRELLDSQAYQDAVAAAGRVESLRADVAGRQDQRGAADQRAQRASAALRAAQDAVEGALAQVAAAEAETQRTADDVARAAEAAGLMASAERHLPGRDVDALAADHQVRTERFGRLRRLHEEHATRDRAASSSGEHLEQAEATQTRARDDEAEAAGAVGTAAGDLELRLRDWAADASVAAPPPELLEEWCGLVPGLTVVDPDDGSVRSGPSVVDTARRHVTAARDRVADRRAQARSARSPLVDTLAELDAALAAVLAGVQGEPGAPASWRRRERPASHAGHGAPLWRLVNPSGVGGEELDLLEAALAASGLLDAWVTPDGGLDREDGRLVADVQAQPRAGRPAEVSLLAVLEPDAAGGVPVEVVRRLLAGVGWSQAHADADAGDCIAADGSWRIGELAGRADRRRRPRSSAPRLGRRPDSASGRGWRRSARTTGSGSPSSTARSRRRPPISSRSRRRSAPCPTAAERALGQAVVRLAERGRTRAAAEHRVRKAQRRHADDLERRDRAWADFADHAGAHRFALTDLPGQEEALRRFGDAVTRLGSDLRLLVARVEHADEASARLDERAEAAAAAAGEATEAAEALRTASVRLAAAEENLGQDQRERLDRRAALDAEIERLRELMAGLETRLRAAEVAAATAVAVLERHEESRRVAEEARDAAVDALWTAVDAGFAEALGLQAPERRTVQSAREFTAAVRRELDLQADEGRQEQAWRTCFRELESLRQHLLPTRDAHVRDEDDAPVEGAPPLPRAEVLVDPGIGWQRPDLAADTLAGRVREQRESYDVEQQKVLTTLLESTFIEHLKDRLDYTTRTFVRINEQLSRHPTRRGHLVRVLCEADPTDPEAGVVVAALGQGFGELTADRQRMVRSFLARKIDEARAEATAGGTADWKDELARALDYRRWLKLSLQYRPGAGSPWAVFDAARHAAKSGGEKVVLLSQPLFAAAVVAFDAAGPLAPRWVWLDEAMTGVDAAVKASFMALTVEFDLDVMLTAHDEWCDYVTVPAVAVFDLARHEHLPGVDAVPYLWCGGSMTALDVERIGVAADDGGIPAEGLFADLDAL